MPLEFESGILGIQVQIDKLLDLADRKGIDVSSEVAVSYTHLRAHET